MLDEEEEAAVVAVNFNDVVDDDEIPEDGLLNNGLGNYMQILFLFDLLFK